MVVYGIELVSPDKAEDRFFPVFRLFPVPRADDERDGEGGTDAMPAAEIIHIPLQRVWIMQKITCQADLTLPLFSIPASSGISPVVIGKTDA